MTAARVASNTGRLTPASSSVPCHPRNSHPTPRRLRDERSIPYQLGLSHPRPVHHTRPLVHLPRTLPPAYIVETIALLHRASLGSPKAHIADVDTVAPPPQQRTISSDRLLVSLVPQSNDISCNTDGCGFRVRDNYTRTVEHVVGCTSAREPLPDARARLRAVPIAVDGEQVGLDAGGSARAHLRRYIPEGYG